jgi:hypothetical protein
MSNWKILLSLFGILIIIVCAVLYVLTAPPEPPAPAPPQATSTTATVTQTPSIPVVVPQVQNQTASPTEFTKNFYTWYLQGLVNDQRFSGSDEFRSSVSRWLTPEFIAAWDSIIEQTNANPILLAQDYASSWSTNITTSIGTETATTTTIIVTLGVPREERKLIADLVRTNEGAWRIARVTLVP